MSNIRTIRNYSALEIRTAPGGSGGSPAIVLVGDTSHIKLKTFVAIVSIIQVVIFIFCCTWARNVKENFDWAYHCVLYKMGGRYTPSILAYHQFQRFIMPVFLHADLRHIVSNMIGQLMWGFSQERRFGTKTFAVIYLLSGIGGNLMSAVFIPTGLSIGASSAIFGMLALELVSIFEKYSELSGHAKNIAIRMFIWIGLSVYSGLTSTEVDIYGHGGGFITGGLLGLMIIEMPDIPRWRRAQVASRCLLAFFVIAMAYLLYIKPAQDMLHMADGKIHQCKKVLGF